jgi:hypothetical protein
MTPREVGYVVRGLLTTALLVGVIMGSRAALVVLLVGLVVRLELLTYSTRRDDEDGTTNYLRGYADGSEVKRDQEIGR